MKGCELPRLPAMRVAAVSVASARAEHQDLAKAVRNPVADCVRAPIQNNTDFAYGSKVKTFNVANNQPVLPFKDGDGSRRTRFRLMFPN